MELWGTLGPACAEQPVLEDLLKAGMDGIRLNTNHTTFAQARDMVERYRQACTNTGKPFLMMIDLQGRQIRTTNKEPLAVHGQVDLQDFMNPQHAAKADRILLDDGKVVLEPDGTGWHVIRGDVILPGKGISLGGCTPDLPLLTSQDRQNLKEAREAGVTAVMVPFVQDETMLQQLQDDLAGFKVYAKIEDETGLKNAAGILDHCDMTVLARGDLGMHVPLEQIGVVEDGILALARRKGRACMVVTQMLDSMRTNPVPTRAEIVDITHAADAGAAALMLTGETAAGQYPVQAMDWLSRTAVAAGQKVAIMKQKGIDCL